MQQGFVRAKRVTDPLNDKVKAQLVSHQLSYVSSGSDHSATADDDFPCLWELVHDFLEHELHDQPSRYDSDPDRDQVDSAPDYSTDKIEDIIRRTTAHSNVDLYRNLLLSHVLKAMELFFCPRQQNCVLRRKVMSFLRELGHNAAICKTKWNSSGGLNGGSYEFIDVVQSTTQNRYFIDLDFASEFEIARPTSEYKRITEWLPRVYVSKSEELKQLVKATSEAARKSLKTRDLTVPPWRKNRYMQNKWFGPYKRTINPILPAVSLAPVLSSVNINKGVQCRWVGFDAGLNGRLYVPTR